jgi:uncharacterized protein YndB with AHSA1/START domain
MLNYILDREMNRSIMQGTLVIDRTYRASPSGVFAAFTSRKAKDAWSATRNMAGSESATGPVELDFRVSRHERSGFYYQSVNSTYDACYYDIVPDQRLVYSYETHADGVRRSDSVATIDFAKRKTARR